MPKHVAVSDDSICLNIFVYQTNSDCSILPLVRFLNRMHFRSFMPSPASTSCIAVKVYSIISKEPRWRLETCTIGSLFFSFSLLTNFVNKSFAVAVSLLLRSCFFECQHTTQSRLSFRYSTKETRILFFGSLCCLFNEINCRRIRCNFGKEIGFAGRMILSMSMATSPPPSPGWSFCQSEILIRTSCEILSSS